MHKHTALLRLKQTEQSLAVIDQIFQLDQDYVDKKELYQMRAETYDEMGNTELSVRNFELALQEYEKEGRKDIFWEVAFKTNYSLALMNGGYYNKARETSEACIALIDEMELDTGEYNYAALPVFINLGIICTRQMQLNIAENYLFKALNLCRKTASENRHIKDEVLTLMGLSWLYHSQHLSDRAQFYADAAADLISKDKQNNFLHQQIELYEIYASIQSQSGNTKDSIRLIDEAIAKAGYSKLLLCNCYCVKGDILCRVNPGQACQQYINALNVLQSMHLGKTELYLMILLNILNAQSIPDQVYLDEAKTLLEDKGIPGGYFKLSAYVRLLSCCINLNNMPDAFYCASRAVIAYSEAMEEAVLHKNPAVILDHKYTMQKIFNLLFFFLSLPDEDDINQFQILDLFLYYKIGDYYLLRLINQSFYADKDHNYRELQLQLNYLQYLSKYLQQQTYSRKTDELISEKYDKIYWAEKDPRKKDMPEPSIEEEYLDFWVIDYYFPDPGNSEDSPISPFAVIFQPKALGEKQYVKLPKAAPIIKIIASFQKAVQNDASTFDQEAELYRLLIEPLIRREPLIKNAKNFIICPEGCLTTVPFDVLFGTDCRILYAPFPDYIFAASLPAAKQAAVCGNPVVTGQNAFGVSPLYDSGSECSAVTAALRQAGYQTHIFYGQGNGDSSPFEKQALLDSLNAGSYSVLHISTHGFYMEQIPLNPAGSASSAQDHPMHRCGLILNDCICDGQYNAASSVLWGEDIICTDLNGAKLAVLSCCVSGIGHTESGDWITGLQRAFMTAGVENLVVSLWNVDENATSILMQYFYQNLCAAQPADLALKQAKSSLRKYRNGIYSTPYYWAGFIYIGKICTII